MGHTRVSHCPRMTERPLGKGRSRATARGEGENAVMVSRLLSCGPGRETTYLELGWLIGTFVLSTLRLRPGAASGGFSRWLPHPGHCFWSRKTVGPFLSRGPLKDGGKDEASKQNRDLHLAPAPVSPPTGCAGWQAVLSGFPVKKQTELPNTLQCRPAQCPITARPSHEFQMVLRFVVRRPLF